MFFSALTPLLPHYVHEFHLGKAGAGVLQAMFPAGALAAGIPGGIAAARLGVKPTVLIGLSLLALTTVAFGLADSVWTLDLARFLQGISSAFSWTGPAFGAVAALALVLAGAAAATPAPAPERPQPLRMLFDALRRNRTIQTGVWLCLLPALCFGTLSVLAPLRLSDLGWGAAAVGATYLVSAAFEAAWSPVLGRISDRHGRILPLLGALAASALATLLLPWPRHALLLGFLVVCAGFAFGSFWTPAMSLVTDAAEQSGLEYGYAFALVNVAWAPGQAGGSAIGGAVASATTDAVSYLGLTVLCLVTLVALMRYKEAAVPLTAER